MRKACLFITMTIAFGVVGGCAQTPEPARFDPAADEASLKADLPRWFDSYNSGVVDDAVAQYADDATLMPPNAPAATGRAAIRAFLAADSAKTKAGGLTLKNTGVTGVGVSGDLAWMGGTYAVVDAKGTSVDVGKYLSIHRRISGGWVYIRDTWNSDNEPPPPAPAKTGK
jgi:ketosteroid isomerase-like protein